jgi:phage-related protein
MKKYLMSIACIAITATCCTSADAGLIHGGVKGTKKGVKEGVGGTAKGVKETTGGVSKGVKGAVGGVGKAVKTIF